MFTTLIDAIPASVLPIFADLSLLVVFLLCLVALALFVWFFVQHGVSNVRDAMNERLRDLELRQGRCPECDCRFDAMGVIQPGLFEERSWGNGSMPFVPAHLRQK